MAKYLCYGGPYHNKTVELPPGSYTLNVAKMPKQRYKARYDEAFPTNLTYEVVTYSVKEIQNGWTTDPNFFGQRSAPVERALVLVAPRKKPYDPSKVWNTLYRRGYVKTPPVL